VRKRVRGGRHLRLSVQLLRTYPRTFTLFIVCCNVAVYSQQISGHQLRSISDAPLPAEQVSKNLEEKDQQRAAQLRQFTGTRIYRMQYHGLPSNRDAQMVVDVTYRAPNVKEFRVVSQSGSPFVIDHVFRRLMESEQEFLNDENHPQAALNTENYNFTFAGYEVTPSGGQYVLNISPKKKNKFLYRGKIWVDAKDFAVVRIEAEPVSSPSIWIKKTQIKHDYLKVGDFWLPAIDHTESELRFGGHAVLSIEYKDYRITKTAPLRTVQRARIDAE
jgi:hypothetical protein